jgi:hypothetical protein
MMHILPIHILYQVHFRVFRIPVLSLSKGFVGNLQTELSQCTFPHNQDNKNSTVLIQKSLY